MVTATRLYTAEDLAKMPGDEPWEIWEGELRKVPGAGMEASELASWIAALLLAYVRPRRLGTVTGADGTFILASAPDTVVVPDVAFVRRERLPSGPRPKGYAPMRPGQIAKKLALYRRAGVPLVWWVDPTPRTVAVYRDGELVAELGEGDELDGEDILPCFRLPVADIFAED